MSRRGNCWDNAVAESFFSNLKSEQIKKRIYSTRAEAKSEIFDYIEGFYNRVRRHKHLDQLSPYEFERQRQIIGPSCLLHRGKSTFSQGGTLMLDAIRAGGAAEYEAILASADDRAVLFARFKDYGKFCEGYDCALDSEGSIFDRRQHLHVQRVWGTI